MREMKDSGIEWIGQIPKEWNLGRIKYYSEVTLGKMLQNEPKGNFDTNEYYLCAANIGSFTLNLNSIKKMWFSKAEKNKLNLSKGDLLVIEGGDVGSCVYLEKDLPNIYFQNSINRVKSNYKLDIRLIKYILFLAKKVGYIDLICNKATISHLTKEKLEEIFCIVPENEEQQQIADFLDTKCFEIDATAEDIQKEISLLEDYKKSVITEAVTKGLNPDAEMKDSGIEWVGKVPVTWKIMPNKYIMTKKKVIKEVYDDENIISLSMNGVIVRDLEAGGKMPKTFDGYQIVYPGNLLMCLFDYDVTPRCIGLIKDYGVTSPAYSQFVMNNDNYSGYYYYYYLMIDHAKTLLHLAKNLRHSFTEEQLGAILAPVPTVEEQYQIVNYLDTKCSEIDTLIADKKRQLDTLADYKKSLIYEYVTGKKEVI